MIQSKKLQTLDEMWPVFGEEFLEVLSEYPKVQEKYDLPEDMVEFLKLIEEYAEIKQ